MIRRESELAAQGFICEEGLHFPLTAKETRAVVAAALEEDDTRHDITTAATVLSDRRARCRLVARQSGVIAGLRLACDAFEQLDKAVTIRIDHDDGSKVRPDTPVMFLSGHARGLLSAERVALNFVQRLSGIASLTARYGGVMATTFKNFPSFPQRYMEPCTALPVESPVGVKVEPLKRPLQPALYTEGDLHVRQFTGAAARRVARVPFALQQSA